MKLKRIALLRSGILAAAAVTAALVGVLAGAAGAATSAHAARTEKIQLRHTSFGKVLVDSSGFVVYRFSRDTSKKNTCLTVRECSTTWPALTSSGQPTAGPGVNASLLSTIKLPSGQRQVTYAGHPLYHYAAATERGEAGYGGVKQFGGTWYALSASGGNVRG
jgi:predicted lipoprotein with Yx(FWY)xxD motif